MDKNTIRPKNFCFENKTRNIYVGRWWLWTRCARHCRTRASTTDSFLATPGKLSLLAISSWVTGSHVVQRVFASHVCVANKELFTVCFAGVSILKVTILSEYQYIISQSQSGVMAITWSHGLCFLTEVVNIQLTQLDTAKLDILVFAATALRLPNKKGLDSIMLQVSNQKYVTYELSLFNHLKATWKIVVFPVLMKTSKVMLFWGFFVSSKTQKPIKTKGFCVFSEMQQLSFLYGFGDLPCFQHHF